MGHTIEELEERIRMLEAASFALQKRSEALYERQLANVRALRLWIPVALLTGIVAASIYFLSR